MDNTIYLHLAGNKLLISFEYNKHIIAKVKKISGTRWNKSLSRWEAPLSSYGKVVSALDNLKISQAVMERLAYEVALNRKVKELIDKEYHELQDYAPKLALMSHQKTAFELHRMLNGSANFGEMGSGKTASAICNIHWRLELGQIKQALVVCPKSVISGWEEQIGMFSDLTHIALVGTKAERLKRLKQKRDVYIINYEGTWRIEDELLAKGFNLVICDEAHKIKNPHSKQSKSCYKLGDHAEYRIALTGSPVLNSSMDAFGVMRFVDTTVFGESFYSFRNKYFKNVGAENSPIPIFVPRHNSDQIISDRMYTRAMRKLKDECMDLPEAVHLPDRVVTLSPEQDRAYRTMQEEMFAEIADGKTIKITHVLTKMMKLNQITSGWMKDSGTGEIIHFKTNPKFNELKEIIDEAGDQPTIIWAYYKADMKLITEHFGRCLKCKKPINSIKEARCPSCGVEIKYRCSEVQGSTKRRNAEIAKFRFSPEVRAEIRQKYIEAGKKAKEIREELGDLLPDTAASEGLNLQRATFAVFYSRNWSLKDWIQALARNHRKGQDKRVTYVSLVAQTAGGDITVDQRIAEALNRKEDLSKRVNKDDLKLLTGKFKKKHREAFKDVEIKDDTKEIIVDENPDENSDEVVEPQTLF
jgi:SNF2 family DNA or RNA helicase